MAQKLKRRRLLFNPRNYKLAAVATPNGEVQHFYNDNKKQSKTNTKN